MLIFDLPDLILYLVILNLSLKDREKLSQTCSSFSWFLQTIKFDHPTELLTIWKKSNYILSTIKQPNQKNIVFYDQPQDSEFMRNLGLVFSYRLIKIAKDKVKIRFQIMSLNNSLVFDYEIPIQVSLNQLQQRRLLTLDTDLVIFLFELKKQIHLDFSCFLITEARFPNIQVKFQDIDSSIYQDKNALPSTPYTHILGYDQYCAIFAVYSNLTNVWPRNIDKLIVHHYYNQTKNFQIEIKADSNLSRGFLNLKFTHRFVLFHSRQYNFGFGYNHQLWILDLEEKRFSRLLFDTAATKKIDDNFYLFSNIIHNENRLLLLNEHNKFSSVAFDILFKQTTDRFTEAKLIRLNPIMRCSKIDSLNHRHYGQKTFCFKEMRFLDFCHTFTQNKLSSV